MNELEMINEIARNTNGKVEEVGTLPDASGFAIVSMPLPKDHWVYGDKNAEDEDGFEAPPMVFKCGTEEVAILYVGDAKNAKRNATLLPRKEFADQIRRAGQYAVRAATMKGKEIDFDPDALLQNLVVAFLGYWTETGLSEDQFANPKIG